jgi:hypothetical protein
MKQTCIAELFYSMSGLIVRIDLNEWFGPVAPMGILVIKSLLDVLSGNFGKAPGELRE